MGLRNRPKNPRYEVEPQKLEPIINGFLKNADILAWAACCLWGAERQVRALEVLDEAVALCPDAPELLWQRASYARKLGVNQNAMINDLIQLLDIHDPQRQPTPKASDDQEFDLPSDSDVDDSPVYNSVGRSRFNLPEEFRDEWHMSLELEDYSDSLDYSDPLHGLAGINPYVVSALRQLRTQSPERYEEAKQKPCITSLSKSAQALLFAYAEEESKPPQPNPPNLRDLILNKRWRDVCALLQPLVDDPEDFWTWEDIFHLFMAHWALGEEKLLHTHGEKAKVRFQRLQHTRGRPGLGVSEGQMMSLVYWKTGERVIAEKILSEIEAGNLRQGKRIFSYWRYKDIPWDEFLDDCYLQSLMFKGANLLPPIF